MSKSEMRAIRRQIINEILQAGFSSYEFISYFVRIKEVTWFKRELRIYVP